MFYDVSNDALKQTVKETYNAFVRFFKKESKVRKATRKMERLQRQVSKKYEVAKEEKRKLKECKNFIKNKKKIRRQYERLNNLRSDYIDKVINNILDEPPKVIVVEDLDVKQMQQNKKVFLNKLLYYDIIY